MKQNVQTNEQNPNKTDKQSNETQANPQKKKKIKWNPHPRAYMDSNLVEIEKQRGRQRREKLE